MDAKFVSQFVCEQEDRENSPEYSGDSPPSPIFSDNKMPSTSSPKKSRRATQKRVVSVPIRDVEGSRLKGETNTPPSDSWAWRKYGQKPIKGSPYPRCSSSKGCPARKQVERSRMDPTMLVVTYSCEHNHPWPASRNNHNHHSSAGPVAITSTKKTPASDLEHQNPAVFPGDGKFPNIDEGSPITADEYAWFSDLESTSSTLLESPLLAGDISGDADMAMIFATREEDESLFADLGELPECSVVFRRREADLRRCSLTQWYGTTG
ncbi:hypothetical protein RJ639_034845 [Escallonia herrerae]|uniref:WRKY domain-containing protein n=1 Tax=Escallonia herrerae TaxID=1293975 RepID=A0AA89BAY5_9ASTE|nr:hypothetical protein RJ639_034845 [Escallonia herrerae]